MNRLGNEVGTNEFGCFSNIDILRVNIAEAADEKFYYRPWSAISFGTRVEIETKVGSIFMPIQDKMKNGNR